MEYVGSFILNSLFITTVLIWVNRRDQCKITSPCVYVSTTEKLSDFLLKEIVLQCKKSVESWCYN